jgi:hypothetical protein
LLACIEWVGHGFEIVQSIFPGWKFSAPRRGRGFRPARCLANWVSSFNRRARRGLERDAFDLRNRTELGQLLFGTQQSHSSWGPSFDEMPFLKGRTDPFDILPNQRYDRMFELMDCYLKGLDQQKATVHLGTSLSAMNDRPEKSVI